MTILIVANGDLQLDWARQHIDSAETIIAADGGANHLYALGRLPDLVVGDLDSVTGETRAWLRGGEVAEWRAEAEKDETDLELALMAATRLEGEINIIGALGGRLDQQIANILLLTHPDWIDRPIKLLAPHQTAWVFIDATSVSGEIGDTVSLIPLAGDTHVDSATGLKWKLEDSILRFGPARGVSNELTAPYATVKLRNGVVLFIHISSDWGR